MFRPALRAFDAHPPEALPEAVAGPTTLSARKTRAAVAEDQRHPEPGANPNGPWKMVDFYGKMVDFYGKMVDFYGDNGLGIDVPMVITSPLTISRGCETSPTDVRLFCGDVFHKSPAIGTSIPSPALVEELQ